MSAEESFEFNSDVLDSHIDSGVGVVHLKDKIFEMAVDLSLRQMLFRRFELANKADNIKVVLIISNASVLGEKENDRFWEMVRDFSRGVGKEKYGIDCQSAEMIISREENTVNQFIKFMLCHKKLIISAVRGSVVTPFFGAILGCDYRIACEDTVFSFPHFKYGLPPRGALAFMLPKYIGYGKAQKILLRGKPIKAMEAEKLGLVDKVFPEESFEDKCLEIAREFTGVPGDIISMTKKLLANNLEELEKHLQNELQLISTSHVVKISKPEEQQT